MNIESEISELAVEGHPGEELYYDYSGLCRVIDLCEQRKIVILGLEGFRRNNATLIPDLEAIADFSAIQSRDYERRVNLSLTSCREFLSTVTNRDRLLWSIVLEGLD